MPQPEKLKRKLLIPEMQITNAISEAVGDIQTGETLYALSTILRMAGA